MTLKNEKIVYFSSILLIVVLVLLWIVREKPSVDNSGGTKVTFLDIGQGDATFIEFESGEKMLVDCALDATILEALGRTMKFYDNTIEYLVVTHPDLDHYGGCIDVLKRFDVKHILYNGEQKKESQLWQSFMEAVVNEEISGADFLNLSRQFELDLGSTQINFLYPDNIVDGSLESNNNSIIMKITNGDHDILMTADGEKELEEYLIENYGEELQSEILKLGHHGSLSSSIQEFLDIVKPIDAIVSSGQGNKFGHPSERVLKRVGRSGANIWRTDLQGDIIVLLNNSSYSIQTGK